MKRFHLLCAIICICSSMMHGQSELYPQHFDLNEICIGDGVIKHAMDTNTRLLLEYDVDRLCAPFIRQAGLTDNGESKYHGWLEKHPLFTSWAGSEWSTEGQIGGHYLSALSLAYAASDDSNIKKKLKSRLDYMLGILKDCQTVFENDSTGMKGFIGGQPLNFVWKGLYVGDLAPFRQYGNFVPFYCQHKVLAGLRDAYVYGKSSLAKEMFRKLCDWSIDVVGKLDDSQMQEILKWEHGGMNEVLADAYLIFGDEKYLDAAKKYSHRYELNGMLNRDSANTFLDGQHANTQVPKFIGFERIYQNDAKCREYGKSALAFWNDVALNRSVCIGGNSVSEHFLSRNQGKEYTANFDGVETCNTYNMLKLSEMLFDDTKDARYVDFYEKALWNHILSSHDPNTGGYIHFTPLRPQSYRIYSQKNLNMWCCVGTGMENHEKYGSFIFTHSPDNTELYLNLFVACELKSEHFGIKQITKFPFDDSVDLEITQNGSYTLHLRHPAWAADSFSISVNGKKWTTSVAKGEASYIGIKRKWKKGDKIRIELPMQLRYEECPDNSDYVAFKYGPILLAARTSTDESLANEYGDGGNMDHSPGCKAVHKSLVSSPFLLCERNKVLNRITPKCLDQLTFEIDVDGDGWKKLTLEPFFGLHHSRYIMYWYQRTQSEYEQSDMLKEAEAERILLARTVDFVATGEQQSEAGHQVKYSAGSSSGGARGEFYRDAPAEGYIQYTLHNDVNIRSGLSIMCRFSAADVGRKASIYINDVMLAPIEIRQPSSSENIFYNVEYPVPDNLVGSDALNNQIKFQIKADAGTMCPGLYNVWLLKQ